MRGGPLAAPVGVVLDSPALSAPYAPAHRILDLAQRLRRERFDALVCVNERPILVGFLARLLARIGVPLIGVSHTSILRTRSEKLWNLLYSPLMNRADAIVFISRIQRDLWRARGLRPRHETVILNGIDMSAFSLAGRAQLRSATRAHLGIAPSDFVIGSLAVFRPEKNISQLIEAVAELRRRGRPAKALLVGDGPMRPTIEQKARELGIEAHVVFAGAQGDVRPFIAAFDVGVLCSTAIETLSLAALEMLGAGTPVVMSDIGGAREIVNGENGSVFAVGDTGVLVSLLERFEALVKRDGFAEATRASVVGKFDHPKMVAAYRDFLTDLVKSRRTGDIPSAFNVA